MCVQNLCDYESKKIAHEISSKFLVTSSQSNKFTHTVLFPGMHVCTLSI